MNPQRAFEICRNLPGMLWESEAVALHGLFGSSRVHAEVGVYAGKSLWITAYAMGKEGKLFAIDNCIANFVTPAWSRRALSSALILIENQIGCKVTHVDNWSIDAARLLFQDGVVLDSVYIDARHDYDSILSDIEAWTPLVKSGGIIAGHDYFAQFPGVIDAVNETGPFTVIPNTRIWYRHKT